MSSSTPTPHPVDAVLAKYRTKDAVLAMYRTKDADAEDPTRAMREYMELDTNPHSCKAVTSVYRVWESKCASGEAWKVTCDEIRELFLYCEAKRKARVEARENFSKAAAAVNYVTINEYLMHLL